MADREKVLLIISFFVYFCDLLWQIKYPKGYLAKRGYPWKSFLAFATAVSAAFVFSVVEVAAELKPVVSDPASRELLELAKPGKIDESAFGAGPLLEPGKTYYVAVDGDDEADGLSWETAWRTISRALSPSENHMVMPGDTIVVGEGEFFTPQLSINLSGAPGRPVTIMGAPNRRATLVGGFRVDGLRRTPGLQFTWEAEVEMSDDAGWRGSPTPAWEGDSLIMLQDARAPSRVEKFPGTYCYDKDNGMVYVRFTDSRGPDKRSLIVLGQEGRFEHWTQPDGIEVRGEHICFRNLHFKHYHVAVHVHDARHITFENCVFSATAMAGLRLGRNARRCLVRENYGFRTGARGTVILSDWRASDNLFIRNRFDTSDSGIRRGAGSLHYAFNNYDHAPRRRISGMLLIDNLITAPLSFRSKFVVQTGLVQGNVMLGRVHTERWPYSETEENRGPDDRLVFRNNVLLGNVRSSGHAMGPGGPAGNWIGGMTVFVNNFAPPAAERATALANAGFADPAWHDYRLQHGSQLKGAGLGGFDKAVVSQGAEGRIFYVGDGGDDRSTGRSADDAFLTPARALHELLPGDTLYVKQGVYADPLEIKVSGRDGEPVVVRSYKRAKTVFPGVLISGSNLLVEGVTASGAPGDGFLVSGDNVTLRECVASDNKGSGVKLRDALGARVLKSTLAHNITGVSLAGVSCEFELSDSILAYNKDGGLIAESGVKPGYIIRNNCFWNPGAGAPEKHDGPGNIFANPLFADAVAHDYRLKWDSPAAMLDGFGLPSGAFPVMVRDTVVSSLFVTGTHPCSAVISWTTLLDDTRGVLEYRQTGLSRWSAVSSPAQGTRHTVSLNQLNPDTEYEARVRATGVRGGSGKSDVLTFRTLSERRAPVTWHLAPDGDDENDGYTYETAWRSFARANAEVAPGDTVLIAAGRYSAPIDPMRSGTRDARITYQGEPEGVVIVDGEGFIAPMARLAGRSYVTLENLVFVNQPPRGAQPAVIFAASGAHGVEVLNCRLGLDVPFGGLGNGVFVSGSRGFRMENTVIWGTRYQLRLDNAADALIKNNTFVLGDVLPAMIRGDHDGLVMVNNVWYCPSTRYNPNIGIYLPAGWRSARLRSDYNLFLDQAENRKVARINKSSGRVVAEGETLECWQNKTGLDAHSIQADPLFINTTKGDFRLRPGSPAAGSGEDGADIGALPVVRINK